MGKPKKLARTGRNLLVFLAIFVPLIPASWYQASTNYFGRVSDLPEYYAASWLILEGRGADIYVLQRIAAAENTLFPSMSGRVVPLFMAPPVSVLVAPLALIPVELCHYLWCALLVASIAGFILVIAKLWKFSLEQCLFAWIFLCTSGPVFESIRIGQIAPFLLLAFSCALYFLGKEPLPRTTPAASTGEPALEAEPAGASCQTPAVDVQPLSAVKQVRTKSTLWTAFSLALLSCKPQILIPLLVALAGAGRYKVLSLTISLIMALALISLILIGPSGWQNYVSLLSSCFNDMSIMHAEQNPTVRGQLLRLLPASSQQSLVSLVSGCAYLLALATIFGLNSRFRESGVDRESALTQADETLRAREADGDWLAVAVLTVPIGLVCSQYLMTYDVLLLVPAIAIFVVKKLYTRFSPFVVLPAVFLGIVYMLPFYSFVHYGWVLKGALWNPFFLSLLYFALLLSVSAFQLAKPSGSKESAREI